MAFPHRTNTYPRILKGFTLQLHKERIEPGYQPHYMPAHRHQEQKALAAMLAVEGSAGVALEANMYGSAKQE